MAARPASDRPLRSRASVTPASRALAGGAFPTLPRPRDLLDVKHEEPGGALAHGPAGDLGHVDVQLVAVLAQNTGRSPRSLEQIEHGTAGPRRSGREQVADRGDGAKEFGARGGIRERGGGARPCVDDPLAVGAEHPDAGARGDLADLRVEVPVGALTKPAENTIAAPAPASAACASTEGTSAAAVKIITRSMPSEHLGEAAVGGGLVDLRLAQDDDRTSPANRTLRSVRSAWRPMLPLPAETPASAMDRGSRTPSSVVFAGACGCTVDDPVFVCDQGLSQVHPGLALKAEHSFADDVALDLVGSPADGHRRCGEELEVPLCRGWPGLVAR